MPEFKQLDIGLLDPNPWQVRQELDIDEGFVASIKESPLKVRNPPLVRPFKNRYQIGSGHRRVQGAKDAGEKTIWCKVEALSDLQMMQEVITENKHRKNLSTNELYQALKQYKDAIKTDNLTELARQTSTDDQWVREVFDAIENIQPKLNRVHGLNNTKLKPSVSMIADTKPLGNDDIRVKLIDKAVDKQWDYHGVKDVTVAIKDKSDKIRIKLIDNNMDSKDTVKVAESIKTLDENISLKILDGKSTPEQKVKIAESLKNITKESQIKVVESKLTPPVMAELSRLKVPETIESVAKQIRVMRYNDEDAIKQIDRVAFGIQPQTTVVVNEIEGFKKEVSDTLQRVKGWGFNQYGMLGEYEWQNISGAFTEIENHMRWLKTQGWKK